LPPLLVEIPGDPEKIKPGIGKAFFDVGHSLCAAYEIHPAVKLTTQSKFVLQ
jgi:hypothetical protein